MNNIKLLEYSIKNPEKLIDKAYMFTEKHEDLDLYVDKTKKIKNLLITIKQLKDKKKAGKVLCEIFNELGQELKQHANYSEFGCFINACDSDIGGTSKNPYLLKKITYLYLENRELNEIVPGEWIQALLDKGATKRKGGAGEKKLINILKKRKFLEVDNIEDFKNNEKSVAKLSKSGDFSIKNIKENFGVLLGQKTQGKILDLIIKKGKEIYFLEAKHINTSGGGQNKQVLELIEIMQKKSQKNNCHFVAFLDGTYFNCLLDLEEVKLSKKQESKIDKQRKDIVGALKKNKDNYFLNTAGFCKLFS